MASRGPTRAGRRRVPGEPAASRAPVGCTRAGTSPHFEIRSSGNMGSTSCRRAPLLARSCRSSHRSSVAMGRGCGIFLGTRGMDGSLIAKVALELGLRHRARASESMRTSSRGHPIRKACVEVGDATHVLPKPLQNALRNTNVDRLLSVHQHVTTAEVVLQLEALKEATNAD